MLARAGIDVPSVELLTAGTLSKVVHFATNDCGHSGTRHTLIESWVYTLFLKDKTKANKSDNPHWKSAMNGLSEKNTGR
jgi:hypothetical protein